MALSPFDPLALARWEPFRDMREMMNRMLPAGFGQPSNGGEAMMFPVSVSETDNDYTIEGTLPGIKPEEINITVQNNVVTISAERKEQRQEKEGERTVYDEHRYGRFMRSFSLPQSVKSEDAKAKFENGVLRLMLPKSAAARSQQIKVEASQPGSESSKPERQEVQAPAESAGKTR